MSLDEKLKEQTKSFWERPEGTTGMIVAIALLFFGATVLWVLLPYLISLMTNILWAGALFVGVAIMLKFLLDKKFWLMLSYGYKSIMRKITGAFITIDPIGIMLSYVESLKEKLVEMSRQLQSLEGQIRNLKNIVAKNTRDAENALKLAGQAKEKGKKGAFVLQARQAGRLKDSNMTLGGLLKKMELLERVLNKYREASEMVVTDTESQVQVAKQEREAITSANRAMKMAERIIKGGEEKELFDQTMEYVAEDIGRKVGEIESFVKMSTGFIESVDLQNGVYEEEALKLLEEWEKKGDSILLGDSKASLLGEAFEDTTSVMQSSVASDDYRQLLK